METEKINIDDENQTFRFIAYNKKRRIKQTSLNLIIIKISIITFIAFLFFFIIGLFMGRYLSPKKNIIHYPKKYIYSRNQINSSESYKQTNSNINIITGNPIIYNNSKNITIGSQSINYISFAQQLEDFILFIFLYDVEKGFYIDIGANNPMYDTVTRNFYEKGWNGINIEPLDDKYTSLIQNRKRDINLQMVASNKSGNVALYVNDQLTTFEKNMFLTTLELKK